MLDTLYVCDPSSPAFSTVHLSPKAFGKPNEYVLSVETVQTAKYIQTALQNMSDPKQLLQVVGVCIVYMYFVYLFCCAKDMIYTLCCTCIWVWSFPYGCGYPHGYAWSTSCGCGLHHVGVVYIVWVWSTSYPPPPQREILETVAATAKVTSLWASNQSSPYTGYIVWRYIATPTGVMRIYPGVQLASKDMAIIERPW